MNNKRQFQRVLFNHDASLTCNGHQWSTHVIDLSLQGLSCTTPRNVIFDIDQLMTLSIKLAQEQVIIMDAVIVHNEKGVLGMRCTRIDINSISELRRLVQLNLADEALLQRDIEHLAISLPKL